MEKKTKQRLTGAALFVAFILILLPFLQMPHEKHDKVLSEAPPFPDTIKTNIPPIDQSKVTTSEPQENLIKNLRPYVVQKSEDAPVAEIQAQTPAVSLVETSNSATSKKVTASVKPALLLKSKTNANTITEAWVIQIGSFKNRNNARHLVNELRAHGYHAFMQNTQTSLGNSTRVFVGPEGKHTSARKLAQELKQELKIEGIVLSFNPLSL